MVDPDPFVSNGTCYYAARTFMVGVLIPYGNVAFGNIHCCQKGDHCLEEGACYNEEYGTTYLAGCTDLYYEDASCPDKKSYRDYPWAGLIYCGFDQWVACEEEGAPTNIREGDECSCPSDDDSIAFYAPSIIPGIGVLPTETGGTIEWSSGHLPTTTQSKSTFTTTTTDSSTTITSPPSPIPTNPSTDSNQNNNPTTSSLSTAAIAGIATGASIGAILLLGALSALWLVFRRRRNSSGNDKNKNQDNNTNNGTLPGAETGTVPALPPHAGADKSPPLAEMPSPEVPQLAFSELSGAGGGGGGGGGAWVARPELLGDVSPPVSPPLSPPGSGLGSGLGSGFATPVAGGWGVQSGGFGGFGGQQGYYMAMSPGEHGQYGYYMPQGGQGQPAYHVAQGDHGQQPYPMAQSDHGQQAYHMAQGDHGQQPYHIAQGEVQGHRPPTAEGSKTGQEGASELPA
ncbi:hypothetical protein F5144DRAFT_648306 [Chaetomium tenue]|uniref:Uncharacterized protein n=1 Tax=Chaetomium tenue TaxID=1854479 RepID=A0ACB7P6A2_9PEZI|nr:hypothetical protein F5144DRAFT_648306 [Chaetomium globosum]